MSFFMRLRRSHAGFYISLTAIVWLSLVPLVQIVPVVGNENGQLGKFIICTSLGLKLVEGKNSRDPSETNKAQQSTSCVICSSQQIQNAMVSPDIVDSHTALQRFGQRVKFSIPTIGVLPACLLPESRAPPLA